MKDSEEKHSNTDSLSGSFRKSFRVSSEGIRNQMDQILVYKLLH